MKDLSRNFTNKKKLIYMVHFAVKLKFYLFFVKKNINEMLDNSQILSFAVMQPQRFKGLHMR